MPNKVKIGLIQAKHDVHGDEPVSVHKEKAIEKHIQLVREAAAKGAQIICLQEIFYGPYFCTEQKTKWYESAEEVPNGPTTRLFQDLARELGTVIVLPVYELAGIGIYYNTAAVIDADGTYLGKYRKQHIPHVAAGDPEKGCGFWEKYYFKPGNLGYPVFDTAFAKVGVYICYDRHFPEGARLLGLNGAEIIFNPSATVAGLSEYLWKLEQPAHAVANGYYVGAINRVGYEAPWNMGEFYGQSYLVDPRGQFVAVASRDQDEVIVAEMDKNLIHEVRDQWQFYRDRRPETYDNMVRLLP
ncbi:nitrilase-related carbon-nitrogen hydrolase [Brevibacillus sp. SYSU BS000544]|uniref:nitrilase-related carbon-nitrogen hydrolase n=1 Tax=Brevibacillus sp. SYSU BS000544 TaxID=3416443 RepID=UPI003CE4FC6F